MFLPVVEGARVGARVWAGLVCASQPRQDVAMDLSGDCWLVVVRLPSGCMGGGVQA